MTRRAMDLSWFILRLFAAREKLVRVVPRQFSKLLASAGQVSFLQQGADDVRLRLSRHRSGNPR